MTFLRPALPALAAAFVAGPVAFAGQPLPADPARGFEQFEFLLGRSPFSLPTAEEKSPAAERFSITGAASWDGVQRVFVLDKNSQERHMLSVDGASGQLALLEYMPDSDPKKMRARIKIGAEIATISYSDPAPQAGAVQGNAPPQPGIPAPPQASQSAPGQQVQSGSPEPPRRIIRRRVITGAPAH